MRRLRMLAAAVGAVVAVSPMTSAAADDSVAEMIEEASHADYHGTGLVMCSWGDDSAAASYTLTRSDGMSMVYGPGGELMASGGTAAMRSGADWYGTRVEEWAVWSVSERYTMGGKVETERLGRAATEITVLEDGLPRVRMIVDAQSAVPLATEVLDDDGRVFRIAALVSFSPGAGDAPDEMPEVEGMGTVAPMAAPEGLPGEAGGYVRADVYDGGPGMVHAFYTDGIFSFSLFQSRRAGRPPAFERATEFATAGNRYRRIVTPTSLWVHWDAPDHTYVLVGDLPPDHLERVLGDLPEPGQRNWLVRLWRRLFG